MSNLFRYLLSAEQVVNTLLRAHPEDEAMARAVGGEFERIGVLEHAVLREHAALTPTASVIDVGCGSGRLAVQLARHAGLTYLGTDVVPSLLDYARRRAGRPDFRFINVDRIGIPASDESADIVCFFSVLTHLLHEESYLYLQEAQRVLRPGGRIVFSFLEYDTPIGWSVFEANLDWVRTRVVASQINVFMPRSMIRLWARRLGLRVELLRDGEKGAVTVGAEEATGGVPVGPQAFGQSLCVLYKPLADGSAEAAAAEGAATRSRRKRERRADRPSGAAASATDARQEGSQTVPTPRRKRSRKASESPVADASEIDAGRQGSRRRKRGTEETRRDRTKAGTEETGRDQTARDDRAARRDREGKSRTRTRDR